jgi:penicillin-binding protein 1A
MAPKKPPNQPQRKSRRKSSKPRAAAQTAHGARRFLKPAKWTLVILIWLAIGLGGVTAWYGWDLPDISRLETPERRPAVTLTAADGSVFARFGDYHGGSVAFRDLPPHLVQAVVATEDRRFFSHGGFDPWAVARAMVANIRAGTIRQGGSTLTQQLAKNLFLTPDRNIRRKVQELLAALWLEARFTKEQIFAIYANRVYLGAGTQGVEAAARRYFNKSVRNVTLHEAALLAGLLKAPSRYSPLRHPGNAKSRAEQVLKKMVAAGFLSAANAAAAPRRSLTLNRSRATSTQYFADWIMERAAAFVGDGKGDLVITTTLDRRLQKLAAAKLGARLAGEGKRRRANQGALIAMSPDGAVQAMTGGRNYRASQFNRATQALRQPGSAFKLFVYLAGLEAGLDPDTQLVDRPINIKGWKPRNYSGRFGGKTTLGDAFARSLNTVAVQVSEHAGRNNVISAARRLGITATLKSHPSLALGASEVTLIELTAAYAVIANRGIAAWPYGIIEIRDSTGSIIYRRGGSGGGRVVDQRHVAELEQMLQKTIAEGTGRRARINRPAAGKTGTSQEWRDAWFIGYTADLVTGIWVGNDDGRPMKKVTGGGLPARIWREFMLDAHRGKKIRRLPQPGRGGIEALIEREGWVGKD